MAWRPSSHEVELLRCFRASDCAEFTHTDHVHVAWMLLQQHPLTAALEQFRRGAMALATSRGHPEIYHETITWAYMVLIHARHCAKPAETWTSFAECQPDLLAPKLAALRPYYSEETLQSELAKRCFVLPDCGPNGPA